MSVSIEYEDEGHGVLLTCKGAVNSDEVIAINAAIHEQGRLINLRYYLLDLSDTESVDVSADKLRYLAEQLEFGAELVGGLKIAVVTNHVVVTSIVQMLYSYLDESGKQFEQFNSLADARLWLAENDPVKCESA